MDRVDALTVTSPVGLAAFSNERCRNKDYIWMCWNSAHKMSFQSI